MTQGAIIYTDTQEDLDQIHRPDVGAVVWHRPFPEKLQPFLDWLTPDIRLHAYTMPSRTMDQERALRCELKRLDTEPNILSSVLAEIEELSNVMRQVSGGPYVDTLLRHLEKDRHPINSDASHFHIDGAGIAMRMVVTYRGNGTELAPAPLGNRFLEKIMLKEQPAPETIHRLGLGDVVLLKGQEYYPEGRDNAQADALVYHRKSEKDVLQNRLVLRLGANSTNAVNMHAASTKWRPRPQP